MFKSRFIRMGIMLFISTILITACKTTQTDADEPQKATVQNPKNKEDTDIQTQYHKISAEEAKKRMDSDSKVILLDVRTQEEYDDKHIKGAILIPNEEIHTDADIAERLPDKDAEILVYCRSGSRSQQAAKKLIQAGYTNVYDFGGIIDWTYETE